MRKAGVRAVDTDSIQGLGKWYNAQKEVVTFPKNADREWLESHNYLWDKDFLGQWLVQQKSSVYLFGLSGNIFDVLELFDKAFILDMSPELLKQRFADNERLNPMGQTQEQQIAVLKDLKEFSEKAKEKGCIAVSADQSPEEIYKIIRS